MKTKNKFLVIMLIVSILVTSSIVHIVNAADTPTEGSLTITKMAKDASKPEQEAKPFAGVKFRIYKVDDDTDDPELADKSVYESDWDFTTPSNNESKSEGGKYYAAEMTTNSEGQAKFKNLPLGRYLVEEYEAPENVKTKIKDFLIDIPYTDKDGTELNYNPEVQPKNEVEYGTITLTKVGNSDDEKLIGVKFKLQKLEGENWIDILDKGDLETGEDGTIKVEGLDIGQYRFIEDSLGDDPSVNGYILDNKTPHTFEVKASTGATQVEPDTLKVKNEKPTITKTIEEVTTENTNARNDNKKESANIGDTVKYKLVVDIPSSVMDNLTTYEISDIMDDYLELQDDMVVKAFKKAVEGDEETTLDKDTAYTLTTDGGSGETWKITFSDKASLKEYYKLEITYSAKVKDIEGTSYKKTGYNNNAKLAYSSKVTNDYNNSPNDGVTELTNSSEKVLQVGGFRIEKRANSGSGKTLEGATFKIATSEEEAKAEHFIKDKNGSDIEITTDGSGLADYYGLSYGKYYLVETKAPKDKDTGKQYNLLRDPEEITIGEESYEDTAKVVIINKLGTLLPETGGIGAIIFVVGGLVLIVVGLTLNKKEGKEKEKEN